MTGPEKPFIGPKALELLENKEVLLAKKAALEQITALLVLARHEIEQKLEDHCPFPQEILEASGKVSRGENYQELPYQVLDFPAFFSLDDIFAFRTMFWWGHFFSTTLHLQGKYLELYRDKMAENISLLVSEEVFICTNETPWEYHYRPDNYAPLSEEHLSLIKNAPFIKLSKYLPLSDYVAVPAFATNFITRIMAILT
mgnify:CR=1 FL=1